MRRRESAQSRSFAVLRMTASGGGGKDTHLMGACLDHLLEAVILSTAKDLLFLVCSDRCVIDGLGPGNADCNEGGAGAIF